MTIEYTPQIGQQTEFLKSTADITIYGGAAGGGKSFALLLHALALANVGSDMVIFRETHHQLIQQGGLWDNASELYLPLGARSKKGDELTFDMPWSGGSVTFNYMGHEDDKYKFQGAQIPCIGWDELTHFSKTQFNYMMSRNRDPKGLVIPHIRATCNPDPDSWVAEFLSWWIGEDGFPLKERANITRYFVTIEGDYQWGSTKKELIERFGPDMEPKSAQFIPASIYDNKILMQNDPSYVASLKALDEVEKQQLLLGNWKAKRVGKLFKNPKFRDWDFRYDSTAWVDTAFGGGNNTAICFEIQVDGIFTVIGFEWQKSVIELYGEFERLAKLYNCGTITFESNADKGASAREFRKRWPNTEDHNERDNKHNKIVNYGVYKWNIIYIASEVTQSVESKMWLSNLLAYEEKKEPDDGADAMASLIRKRTTYGEYQNLGRMAIK